MKTIKYKRSDLMTAEELTERYKPSKALALSIEKWVRAGYSENWEDITHRDILDNVCALCKKNENPNSMYPFCHQCTLKSCDSESWWDVAKLALLGHKKDRPAFMKARKNLLAGMRRAYDRGER